MTQLALPIEPQPNPLAGFFGADGKPLRLLWCSDDARMGGECPYVGEKARFMPDGVCCKDLKHDAA